MRRLRARRCYFKRLLSALIVAFASATSGCADLDPNQQLLSAAVDGDISAVESLLADPAVDPSWRAPITGQNALGIAAAHNRAEIVRLLLQQGVSANIADRENMTPLHSAAYHGYADIAKMLIEAGADVDAAETRYGFTPLAYSARNGHAEVIKLLLDSGADPNKRVNDGRTPLQLADQYQQLNAAMLLSRR